ncbi:hypothetical protein AX14_012141 [Amanita brunnescens Koide BX004]|nr:hypothetical protein AX14_012141 [Amanita brunnescens Koide BX004]
MRPREFPKYWDAGYKRVVQGVEIRETPTRLADILGTYVWVFSGDPEFPEDVEDTIRGYYKDDAEFIAKHTITLDAAKRRPGKPVAPKDVTGHISWGSLKVTFNGVRRVRRGRSSKGALVESYWEVLLTEGDWDKDHDSATWLDLEGNAVGAAVVLDDNGSPFLVFDWHHPPGGHMSWSGYYLGKRLVEGKSWRLTGAERDRLGIGATFRGVEQLFNEGTPGEYSEDSEEEDYYRVGTPGAYCEDSEEEDLKIVGKKRKAETSETGAKKRKVSANETGANKTKASTSKTAANKTNASADRTGAKKSRKRRQRRAKAQA